MIRLKNNDDECEGAIGRIFELYEEGAIAIGLTVEEYLDKISPNDYVKYSYERYIERNN